MDSIVDSFRSYVVGHVPSVAAYLIFAAVVAFANLLLSRHVAAAMVAKVRSYPRGAAVLDLLASLGIQPTEIVDAFLRILTGKLGGPGSPTGDSIPPEPKAAPPGTFRSSLERSTILSGIAFAAFVVIVAIVGSGCAAFKADVKTALNDVQIACVLEQSVGIDSVIPGQEAAMLAGICHVDEALIPVISEVLSAHRHAVALEIVHQAAVSARAAECPPAVK